MTENQTFYTSYTQGSVTIDFFALPLRKGQIEQKYSFAIKGNEELTKIILAAVKSKHVTAKSIYKAQKALFHMIEKGDFEPLAEGEEIRKLFEKFQVENSCSPLFVITNESIPNAPCFSAKIFNSSYQKLKPGKGRTKQQAKYMALKNFFEVDDANKVY